MGLFSISRFILFVALFLSWNSNFLCAQACPLCATLEIIVRGVQPKEGVLRIMLTRDQKNFEESDPQKIETSKIFFKNVNSPKAEERVVFLDVPSGRYAFKVFQDINSNEFLDTTLIGKPVEPHAISGYKKISSEKLEFSKASFDIKPRQKHRVAVTLMNLVKK